MVQLESQQEIVPIDPDDIVTSKENLISVSNSVQQPEAPKIQLFEHPCDDDLISTNIPAQQSTSSELATGRDVIKRESPASLSSEQFLPSADHKTQRENPSNTVTSAAPSHSIQAQTNVFSVAAQQVSKSSYPVELDEKPTFTPSPHLPSQASDVEDKPNFENFDDSEFDDLIGEFENPSDFYKSFDITDGVVENRSSNQKRVGVVKDDPDYVIDVDSSGDDDYDDESDEGAGPSGKQGEEHVPTVGEMAEEANTTDLFDPKITGLFLS